MNPSQQNASPTDVPAATKPASSFSLEHADRLAETVVLIRGRWLACRKNVMALSNITCPAMVPVAGGP